MTHKCVYQMPLCLFLPRRSIRSLPIIWLFPLAKNQREYIVRNRYAIWFSVLLVYPMTTTLSYRRHVRSQLTIKVTRTDADAADDLIFRLDRKILTLCTQRPFRRTGNDSMRHVFAISAGIGCPYSQDEVGCGRLHLLFSSPTLQETP